MFPFFHFFKLLSVSFLIFRKRSAHLRCQVAVAAGYLEASPTQSHQCIARMVAMMIMVKPVIMVVTGTRRLLWFQRKRDNGDKHDIGDDEERWWLCVGWRLVRPWSIDPLCHCSANSACAVDFTILCAMSSLFDPGVPNTLRVSIFSKVLPFSRTAGTDVGLQ